MQFRITLSTDWHLTLPFDHGSLLKNVVYDILTNGYPEYARWLRDEGYTLGEKRYRMFCFSGLRVPKERRLIDEDELVISPGTMLWSVTSPMPDFLQAFAKGLSKQEALELAGVPMQVENVDTLPTPEFMARENFTCLTPVVMTFRKQEGQHRGYMHAYHRDLWNERLRANLAAKYELIYKVCPAPSEFEITWDMKYVKRSNHGGSKKITISQSPRVEVYGMMSPFVLRGDPALIQVAYECGLGEYNSLGLGMIVRYVPLQSHNDINIERQS